ncbi:methylenetetrahydrofolate dehydrogenase (NADP+) / methenyltetrahydrofolate cyclohydrolase [Caloramator fervidus]|uniref:Bifunctional protein FolD n=1 Tax=Caloramator fervidus TaxID=29344 RepID=A0A1H5V519_9CLOT|nr:bifunctional 5,10-methylenetetrahydrofolate dehydrogenase/5,10-methenyltetrahydrofolate cyclohydrolase [Caloramator fervidus]SEF82300.1 methylenetetrahydrofolate dehydrogenase (NADP+) / methenyltetrahydrofolate cyclohydrolase [Caloramator fervidus]
MAAYVINCKEIAKKIREELSKKAKQYEDINGQKICLATIIVGKDPASLSYVKNQEKVCIETGLKFITYELSEDTSEEDLIELIKKLNDDSSVHGILVQVPLPKHIDENKIAGIIDVNKDVDCFNPINVGKLYRGEKCLLPCTPKGILRILKEMNIEIRGKKVAVVGRSNIVGKPIAALMLHNDATVTICHSKTENLKEILLNSDIIISAVGKPKLITEDMIKEGAVIVDAGTTLVDGKLVGDVDFENVLNKASMITPVPGGVGSMTTTMLIENVLEAANIYG